MRRVTLLGIALAAVLPTPGYPQRYRGADGKLRVALVQQAFSPTGVSADPHTMATGGIQELLNGMGAAFRVHQVAPTPEEVTEYGGWKRLGMALGHSADDAGARRGAAALRAHQRADQYRHALARRFHHSTGQRQRPAEEFTRRIRAARSARSIDREDLHPYRQGCAGSERSYRPPEQGARRSLELGAGSALRADLPALSESVDNRFCHDPGQRSGGLSLAAVNRMIADAVHEVAARETRRRP